ncbi:MAG: V-type ATP synthase subunit F [Deltaproteobacteria bacterium]|nr:V-type ATP synthase subunit F [Deltaproteobacteria bacterium]
MGTKELTIAMIGSNDQVNFMRMAGIGQWRIITEGGNIEQQVRTAFEELAQDASIGIIIIPDDWTSYINDVLKKIRQQKNVLPAIVEIPTHFDLGLEHIKEFYQTYAKKLIGFSIEI